MLLPLSCVGVTQRVPPCSSEQEEEEEEEGERVDKVYTVGCFDLFHRGHINLLWNMRKLGKEVRMGEN